MPDLQNPQDWNRYSYTRNNPIRYTDSSGHCIDGVSTWVCVGVVLIAGALILSGDTPRPEGEVANSNAPTIDVSKAIDNFVWHNVPSAIGVKYSGDLQAGFMIEGGGSGGLGVVFNWRSMELSIIGDVSANGYLGTPQMFAKGGSLSSFYIYGASRNKNLEGISDYSGVSIAVDEFARVGTTITRSKAMMQDGKTEFIDPVSKDPIKIYQVSINVGSNIIANGVDGGMLFGRSYTSVEDRLTWKLENWRWVR